MKHWVFLTLSLVPLLSFAQKADFSGNWTLNKAKSNFGNLPENLIPEAATRTITNTDGEIRIKAFDKSSRRETTVDLAYKLDGSASVNSPRGAEVKTFAAWDGPAVLMKSKIDVGGSLLDMEERYSLSADRQTMTIETKVPGTPIGDIVVNYVYEKAAAAASLPAFSGTWKLNLAKSRVDALPEEYRPTAMTRVMKLTGNLLAVESDQVTGQGAAKSLVRLKLDGTENVNEMQGAEVRSVAKLSGAVLEVVSKRPFADMTLEITEKNSLSEDGQNLVIDTQIGGTPLGTILTRMVFDRQ